MKKVLVIGAGVYQIPLIKRLKEFGHKVFCVDGNPKASGFSEADNYRVIDVLNKEMCLEYAKQLGIDAVMTYGATITLPTVAYIGEAMNLLTINKKTAELSKSKYEIKKCLANSGLNTHGSFFCINKDDIISDIVFDIPCVIKPSDGSGSKGVYIVTEKNQLQDAIKYAFKYARFGEIYKESFIGGDEYSVEAFCNNEKVYIYAIVKTTFYKDDNGIIHYGHRVPSGLSKDIEIKIESEVSKAIKALGINIGSVNFDVIVSNEDSNPYIIDVGIRVGQNLIASHIVPFSRGVSELDAIIHICLGDLVNLEPKYYKCIATRLLIYSPGIIKEIRDYSNIIGTNHIVDIVLRKNVGDELRPYSDKSDSCGWVLAYGDTPYEAERYAEEAKNVLKDYIIIDKTKG